MLSESEKSIILHKLNDPTTTAKELKRWLRFLLHYEHNVPYEIQKGG